MKHIFCLLCLVFLGANAQETKFINRFDLINFYENSNAIYYDTEPSEFWVDEKEKVILYFNEKRECLKYKYTSTHDHGKFKNYVIKDKNLSHIKIAKDSSSVIFVSPDNKRIVYQNKKQ
jgi:hypothetical protein